MAVCELIEHCTDGAALPVAAVDSKPADASVACKAEPAKLTP